MVERMDECTMAGRLEKLIMHDNAIHEANRPKHKFSKVKLTAKGEKRLGDLINDKYN